jgi:PAS domain S-box-containing protein
MKVNKSDFRILIVEDDAIIASQLQRTLHKMEYSTIGPVATGEEAVTLALREYPDVILMDIKLKGELTGIETAVKIHKEAEIPIIYLTAYAYDETIERSKDKHTYGFLTKPIRDKELGAMIETAIFKSSADRSLKQLNHLLLAIRSIDKLIKKESVPEKLLTEACKILVNTKDYVASWISYEIEPEASPIVFADNFKQLINAKGRRQFLNENLKSILSTPLQSDRPTIIRNNLGLNFFNKIFRDHIIKNPSAIICPIRYREKFYGYFVVFSCLTNAFNFEETELLQTLAEDLAFALNSIEVEKERILAEQTLIESERYFRTLLHSMSEDIIVIDRENNITDTNNTILRTSGLKAPDIIGKKCFSVTHGCSFQCEEEGINCRLRQVFETGETEMFHHRRYKDDGNPIDFDIIFSPIKDENGRVTKVIESIHDVTDLLSTQEALSENREILKQIADNIDLVLFTLKSNEEGETLTYLSPAFERVWGLDTKNVLENSSLWLDSIYPKDRKKLLDSIQNVKLNKNFDGKIEYRIVKPDGSTRWISSSIKNANNNIDGNVNIIGIAEDITDRILTENKLKKSEQGYKNLFDNAHDPIIIFEPERGIILNTNLRACEAFGYDRDELIGNSFFNLFADSQSIYDKASEVEETKDIPTFELEAFKKDKTSIYFEINLSPTDYLGQSAVISVNRNITLRKNTEKELKILSEIVKQSPASVLLTDTNHIIEYANPRYTELTGYSLDEIIGKESKPIKPLDNEEAENIWIKVKSNSVWHGEVMNVNKNNSPYWASLSISPIKNEKDEIVHFLLIEQDITQQKELEIELKLALTKANEINIFKTHLLGNLNHEIRTPMNSIIGFSQIMVEEAQDETVVEMSGKIIKSSYRLLNTLNSIIELSDLESERVKVSITDINLTHFIRYLDYAYKSKTKEKNLTLDVEIYKEDIVVQSDEKLLEQVLKNLLDNAIKYTEKGGIKITVGEQFDDSGNKFCAIKIIDTGIGIREKNRKVIFDAFKQLSEGFTRRYEGTGLGLTIAQKMISLLNGRIEVESTEDLGSTFSVLLPLPATDIVPETIEEESVKIVEDSITHSDRIPHLLIVEDYIMNVDIMKYFLNDIARMDHTTNYEETIQAVQKFSYDIILMDINLKDSIGGLELMKVLRKIDEYKNKPIIAITGYTSSMDQDTFLKEGFTGFLAKPFNQKQLRDIIFNNFH